jgi:gamma-glutamyl-gamma-aminobutyrate hydrolase PuuD
MVQQSRGRRPVIGIVADVEQIGPRPFHAVGENYINAVAHGAGAIPVLLPATAAGRDLEEIQAVRVEGAAFALGVQWHPERRFRDDHLSTAIFAAFGDAAAAYREGGVSSAAA